MKKIIMSMVLGALCLGTSIAQDSLVVYNGLLSKSIHVENGVSSHKWNLNFLSLSSSVPEVSVHPRGGWHSEWNVGADMVYFGTTQLAGSDVDLNPGSSWEWGFDLMKFESWNRRRTFGYKFGLLLTRSSYRLNGDNAFHVVNGETVLDDALQGYVGKNHDQDYSRQRLIFWSWRVPFVFNFQPSNVWGFSLGAEAELRHHIRSRAKVGSDKKYYIDRHNIDVNPWSCNALASVNIGHDFSITARYNLTDFFGDKAKFDVQPFMIGLCLDL